MERVPEFVKIGGISGLATMANAFALFLLQSANAPLFVTAGCALSTGGLLLAGAGVTTFKLFAWLNENRPQHLD